MNLEHEAILSNYEPITTIDREGRVLLVRDIRDERFYVLKQIPIETHPVFQRLKEAKISGVPEIYHILAGDDYLTIIEEYIHGDTAYRYFASTEKISQQEIIEFGLAILEILKGLHSLNPAIICRDIKPSNLMLSNGKWYIVDFDIARNFDPSQDQDTSILGTASYAPPEQHGFGQTDERSDIYSLAVTMNFLFKGEFRTEHNPKDEFSCIIEKATRLDPKDRFQTADEFAKALQALLPQEKNESKQRESFGPENLSSFTSCVHTRRRQIHGFARFKKPTTYVAIVFYAFLAYIAYSSFQADAAGAGSGSIIAAFWNNFMVYCIFLLPYLYNGNYFCILDKTLEKYSYGSFGYWRMRLFFSVVLAMAPIMIAVVIVNVLAI